jgi:radical SAM protein with 4Fe4S-binding SPASM domain
MKSSDTEQEEKPIIRYFQNRNRHLTKMLCSPEYNYIFGLGDGHLMRWGINENIDPELCKYGPEILDIEVSTICHKGCNFCYKSNTSVGKNMSFDTFKHILDIMPQTLTQIAFGIGDLNANPDLWQMMRYCRDHLVIPNLTINGENMTPQYYDLVASNCGACAVSLYDKDTCYNAVKELTDRGMTQVNIHSLLSEETYDRCMQTLKDSLTDPRLAKLNATVFLFLKPRGTRNTLHKLTNIDKFKELVNYAFEYDIRIGFDSCTSPMFLEAIKDREDYDELFKCVDPCESTLFSYYINADGRGFPCSFNEDGEGIDIAHATDFVKDVWNNPATIAFRQRLLANKDERGCRMCPTYDLCPRAITI